jgi:hypothetical protein
VLDLTDSDRDRLVEALDVAIEAAGGSVPRPRADSALALVRADDLEALEAIKRFLLDQSKD